ncbi:hypothetical protein BGZ47_002890 [Haplosporangium gracile]|nr:hypothetical protein BGZ47_002890 [Haplosporangium gracile]
MKKDTTEQDHLRGLAAETHYRKLLSCFISAFDNARILDVDLLQSLVQLVQPAYLDFLDADDLVKSHSIIRTRLQGTHQQSAEYLYILTLAISRILDVMADHKVKDLNRVQEHESLSEVLSSLKGNSDLYLMYQACYAFQALQYVTDNETPLRAVLRHTAGIDSGLMKVAGVVKLDVGSILEGFSSLQESLGSIVQIAGAICSLKESGQDFFESLKKGHASGKRRPWYSTIRVAYALAREGQLKDLKELIYKAPICQLLGEITSDTVWGIAARRQAISLVGQLYKDDGVWGRDESVSSLMLTIIDKLSISFDQAVCATAAILLQEIASDKIPGQQHPYPLRAHLPVPNVSSILAKGQKLPDDDYDLHRLRMQRLQEASNLRAKYDDLFPLTDKVQEFLASDCQVMLILDDFESGESTFNAHFESELLQAYKSGKPIPLFINLHAIDRPDQDMIGQQFKYHDFDDDQIREMKLHRQFILICDGYDGSQRLVNLHRANMLNQTDIGTPRWSSAVGASSSVRITTSESCLKAEDQIENYVDQYVPLEPRAWTTHDYMGKLTTVPNLLDLVKNLFLLILALEALPRITQAQQNPFSINVTRIQLFKYFVKVWFVVNKYRLDCYPLYDDDRDALDMIREAGVKFLGSLYSTRLAQDIFDK